MKRPPKLNGDYKMLIERTQKVDTLEHTIIKLNAEISWLKKRMFALNDECEDRINRVIKYAENLDGGNGQKIKIDKQKALGYEQLNDIAYNVGDKK